MALSVLLQGCGEPAPVAAPPKRVILISIDTLRADRLSLYGYPRRTSPVLDAFAEEAVVFEDVSSPSPWTLPAHASLFSGLYPNTHRLNSHERRLRPRVRGLADILAEHGFRTAAVVNSYYLSRRFGLDRGFRDFVYVKESVESIRRSDPITDQAIEWLSRYPDQPVFLFVHYYDVHSDYTALPRYLEEFVQPYDGRLDGSTAQLLEFRKGSFAMDAGDAAHLLDRYDASIRQMDDDLGRLFSFLREQGWLDESLIVVTSDHGEAFLEHGTVLHGQNQYQEVQRVPLVIRSPNHFAARRIDLPVSLVDVAPTLLSLLGIEPPEPLDAFGAFDGVDLSPLLASNDAEPARAAGKSRPDANALRELLPIRVLFGEADHTAEAFDITRSVRRGNVKLHFNRLTGRHELYDLEHDPGEQHDIAPQWKELAKELLAELSRFEDTQRLEAPVIDLSPEEREALERLGYGS